MERRGVVYRRRGKLLIAADSRTVDGAWITFPPYRQLDADASPADVGRALAESIQLSRWDVPHPHRSDRSRLQALLDAAGVRSYSTFMKGALVVEVSVEGECAELVPLLNRGGRGGFDYPVPPSGPRARVDDHVELGKKVYEALELAE